MSKIINMFNKFKKDCRFKINESANEYVIKKELGEGRFGITYLGENSNGKKVTIKQLKKSMLYVSLDKVKYEPMILKELSSMNYNYFPKFIDKFTIGDKQGYILEYIEGNTFEEILYKNNKVFEKGEIYNIALKLLDIVEVLESKNIVHKDIRITNVIYTPDEEIKLIDFGLARYIDTKKYKKELDFWYIADFLIHMHYAAFNENKIKSLIQKEKPWYDELDLLPLERDVLMSMMGVGDRKYSSIKEIRIDIKKISKILTIDSLELIG